MCVAEGVQCVMRTKLADFGEMEGAVSETMNKFIKTDVEELVVALQHNLRLKSRPCQVTCMKQKRMSPYRIPTRTDSRQSYDSTSTPDYLQDCSRTRTKKEDTSDPYLLLQELLNEGTLVKEAVRRLKLGIHSTARTKSVDYYDSDDYDRACSH